MGTTATNLHVLSPIRDAASLPEEIERAYGRLGYRKPRKAGAGAAKTVIVAGPGAGGFVTVRDGDNDAIDTGELKDLAVDLSRRLGTVAILTSVQDSDRFEFIVWRAGKPVDAAVDDETRQGDLKIAKGAARAIVVRDVPRSRRQGRGTDARRRSAQDKRKSRGVGSEAAFGGGRVGQPVRGGPAVALLRFGGHRRRGGAGADDGRSAAGFGRSGTGEIGGARGQAAPSAGSGAAARLRARGRRASLPPVFSRR